MGNVIFRTVKNNEVFYFEVLDEEFFKSRMTYINENWGEDSLRGFYVSENEYVEWDGFEDFIGSFEVHSLTEEESQIFKKFDFVSPFGSSVIDVLYNEIEDEINKITEGEY